MISASQLIKTSALACFGLAAWALAGRELLSRPDLDVPLNPLGINGSPYGEVFAMAMQSPIDDYFHVATNGSIHRHAPGETCDDHEADVPDENEGHVHDEHCDHGHEDANPIPQASEKPSASPSLKARFRKMLVSLSNVRTVRTNPRAASEALKRHLRREVENKLRFAYRLDPAHYANYNALHFFLTEPQFGTRPELTPSAASLAQETIAYCLKKTDDPRPALTAAAACTNIIHLMFEDHKTGSSKYSIEDMRVVLATVDQCLDRYKKISLQWEASGNWKLLSPQRVDECLERYEFILKIRNAAEKAITNFSTSQTQPSQSN